MIIIAPNERDAMDRNVLELSFPSMASPKYVLIIS
jgi:hypothetical protein